MSNEEMHFQKWKRFAEEMMGPDFFNQFFSKDEGKPGGPPYNIYRNSSEMIVLIQLPYVRDLSQMKVHVHEQELLVRGRIDLGHDHLDVYEEHIFSGPFELSIQLPESVNTKKVNAQYKQGILSVQLFPRVGKRGGKTVPIKKL